MIQNRFDNKISGPSSSFQPLYKQVEEHLTQLIVEQRWKPGDMLPSELQLANEFDVSQGTMRKALNSLTNSHILIRKQGKGTFVSEHTRQTNLYRFFPLIRDGNEPEIPYAQQQSVEVTSPPDHIRVMLDLKPHHNVIKLVRRRILDQQLCILETIYLPEKYFPELDTYKNLPHTLYLFYQAEYSMTVDKTSDKIKAVLADRDSATQLEVEPGSPLLEVTRLATSSDGRPMEYRVSLCRSDHYHYIVNAD